MSRLDLLPFRLLIDRVPVLIRRHIKTFFWATALPLLAVGLATAWIQHQWLRQMVDPATAASANPFGFLATYFLSSIIALCVYALTYMALGVAAVDALAGRPVSLSRAWLFCLRPTVLGTSFVVAVVVAISFGLCCIPGLFVAPLLALLIPVMVQEHLVGVGAISRTIELVRFQGRRGLSESGWAQAFVVLFVGMVLSTAASMVTQGPFAYLQILQAIRDSTAGQPSVPSAGDLWQQVPIQVLGTLVTVLVWAYWAFGLALLYFETLRRKEAADLERAIDDIVQGPSSPGRPQDRPGAEPATAS